MIKIVKWMRDGLDEIVTENETFHLERISKDHIWFTIGGLAYDIVITGKWWWKKIEVIAQDRDSREDWIDGAIDDRIPFQSIGGTNEL